MTESGRRTWSAEAALAVIVLLVVHGDALAWGQLRGDDYQFLREARVPLAEVLLQPWGGHVFPLWRLEAALAYRVAGYAAEPYRWWLLGHVAVLAFVFVRALAAFGIGKFGRAFAIVLVCGWAQWAQVVFGYWTLSIGIKVWIFTLVAVAAAASPSRQHVGARVTLAVAAMLAVLQDSAGVIVVPAVLAAAWSVAWRDGARGRALVTRMAGPVVVAAACALVFIGGQWLVQAAGGAGLGALGGGSRLRLVNYLFGVGVAGPLAAPVLTTLIPPAALDVVAASGSLAVAAALLVVVRRADAAMRAPLSFGIGILVGGLALLAGGRPYGDFRFMTGWTHYAIFLYVPAVTLVATAWDMWASGKGWSPRQAWTRVAVAGVAFIGVQFAVGRVASRLQLPGGPAWERQLASERAEAVRVIRDSIVLPLASAAPRGAAVLNLPSRHLDALFPRLHPFFDLSFHAEAAGAAHDQFRWITGSLPTGDDPHPTDATLATRLRDAVDPAFLTAFAAPSYWRDAYFNAPPLRASPSLPVACESARRHGPRWRGGADRLRALLVYLPVPVAAARTERLIARTAFRASVSYAVTLDSGAVGCLRVPLDGVPELVMSDAFELAPAGGRPAVEFLGLFPQR